MLAEKFNKTKFLIVVFPGGAGGNHIQNMISLCPIFNKLFESQNYYKDLLKKYEQLEGTIVQGSVGIAAHFNQYNENLVALRNTDFRKFVDSSNLKTVLVGHDHCIQDAMENNFFVNFEDCSWIIVTWPQTTECVVHRRILQRKHWPQQTYRYTFPYCIPTTLYYVDSTKGFALDPIKLFSVNGSHYLRKKLKENFNLELPIEADTLHEIWYKAQQRFM